MWIIWDCNADDYERLHGHLPPGDNNPILLYQNKRAACKRAAELFGFDSYSECKRKGWAVVLHAGISCLPNGRK